MKTSIPDLSIELMGEIARLEQNCGLDDSCVIDLHRLHVEHLAGLMGVRGRPYLQVQVDSLGDALIELRAGIESLAYLLNSVPCYPPGSETEDVTEAFKLLRLADRYCERFDLEVDSELPSEPETAQLSLV